MLFTPVYVFGALVSNDPQLNLICPPVLLIGCNLLHRALFRFSNERNTRQLLLGVAILCLGISASGLVALLCATPHYLLLALLYSVVGGKCTHAAVRFHPFLKRLLNTSVDAQASAISWSFPACGRCWPRSLAPARRCS